MAYDSRDIASFKNVWVYCEQRQGKMMPTSYELQVKTGEGKNDWKTLMPGDTRFHHTFYELDGVRYSHIIDTQTGRPITHKTASVSVIDDSCMTADAWATALSILGPDQGFALAERQNLAVYMISRDAFGERATSAWTKLFPSRE